MTSRSLLALALAASSVASVLPRTANPGFLSFPIAHKTSVAPLVKRDGDVPLFNVSSTSYLVELSVGTPGQIVKVAIDTGSDELWVDPNCNSRTITQQQADECADDGTYDPNSSSTVEDLQTTNEITYGIGQVRIQYVTDNVALPNSSINLTSIQFGVAIADAELNEGILGLGFGEGKNLEYKNFVDELYAQNATQSKAFSVVLGDNRFTNGGSIIFGGVDTMKFSGDLVSNDIIAPVGNDINRYNIQLNSVGATIDSKSKTYDGGSTAVVLDTGSSLSILPSSVVTAMADDFSATYDNSSGLYLVDCSVMSADAMIDFQFPGVKIHVPMADFVFDAGGNTCVLGTQALDPDSGVQALLGDTFLRSAYVVFDQTSNAVLMAPYESCGTHEQTIPAGVGAAARFTGECDATSTNTDSNPNSSSDQNAGGRLGGAVAALWAALAVMAGMSLLG